MGSILGLGRSPRGGNGYPLQYSCRESPMDRGDWWGTEYGVTESDMTEQLSATHTRCRERILGFPSTTFPLEQRRTKCPEEVWHGRRGQGVLPPFLGQGWAGIFSDCLWISLHLLHSVSYHPFTEHLLGITHCARLQRTRQTETPAFTEQTFYKTETDKQMRK